jgi:hypothetical protein
MPVIVIFFIKLRKNTGMSHGIFQYFFLLLEQYFTTLL